jgi:hypothetical protein
VSGEGPCSCDEALALRRELAEEVARHARTERKRAELEKALSVANDRIAELLPLRDGLGRLAKEVSTLRRDLKLATARLGERETDGATH